LFTAPASTGPPEAEDKEEGVSRK